MCKNQISYTIASLWMFDGHPTSDVGFVLDIG
jgi:hypothetical protein